MLKFINNLKLSLRLIIFFGIIGLVGLWGMFQFNHECNNMKSILDGIMNDDIKIQHLTTEAERLVLQCNMDIDQALIQFNTNKQSVTNLTATLGSDLDKAKEKTDQLEKTIKVNSKLNYQNIEALILSFGKYSDVTSRFNSELGTEENYTTLEENYANTYIPVFTRVRASFNQFFSELSENTSAVNNQYYNTITSSKVISFIIFIIIICLLIITGIILIMSTVKPLLHVKNYLLRLSVGELPDHIDMDTKDEIGEIISVTNEVVSGLRNTANFAEQIGEGQLDVEFKALGDRDILGNALLGMRKGLQKAKREELKRKEEDEKRNWTTQGIARFGEILRKDNDNLDKLANDILSNLISYIGANQGGLFMYNDEDVTNIYLELIASFAYDRKKFITKHINLGEGLVGTCAIEKSTIHLIEIPADYIEITSGLGETAPHSIIIVPLKLEDKIFGVIELASFSDFESYKIEFVEKIGESIAATLSAVKINAQTAALLTETKLQAEEMATKEEEMRQNLEELKATQEEMERIKAREQERTEEMVKEMEEHRKMVVRILDQVPEKVFLKDRDGKMVLVNTAVAKVHHTTPEELIGQSDFDFFEYEKAKELFAEEVEIMNTEAKTFMQTEDLSGERRILRTTKMPFYITYLKQTGLLGVQSDITELHDLQEKEIQLRNEISKLEKEIQRLKAESQ